MRENRFKTLTGAGKVMASICWEIEGVLLAEFLKRDATLNLERYVQTLKKLKQRIRWIRPNKNKNEVLIIIRTVQI
jgi:hypothetical protein